MEIREVVDKDNTLSVEEFSVNLNLPPIEFAS